MPTRNGRHETAPSSLLEALAARASREEVAVTDLAEARDRDLVQRIRHGDGEAFRGLFGRYSPSAMSLARRVVRQPFLAEEIVQEAFLAVWRNPGGYDPQRGSVRAWLMGMVHHRAVDAVRREESQRRRTEESQLSDPVIQPDIGDRGRDARRRGLRSTGRRRIGVRVRRQRGDRLRGVGGDGRAVLVLGRPDDTTDLGGAGHDRLRHVHPSRRLRRLGRSDDHEQGACSAECSLTLPRSTRLRHTDRSCSSPG
jgi:RNA polymerase sigma factor (sigma-70 family)